ncbi:PHD finger protein At1g33420 isoform X2 [Amborella trichopoda]|uniref:PHD finger protein At1g33420 isoform X2 n=1 Tax=Amborella trichopoda TaxID=13333 RepID=UPI0009BEF9D2|nr:PHD finger protein At1g33420 isoform X2 [Amborella trichopoda]|eukprot:XP_020519048.1 PHD finger protein At1g33420 isoform X2 [Amborella trichopoda]
MAVNTRPFKKPKRRVIADLVPFHEFQATVAGFSGDFDGPFRSNIKAFISKFSQSSPFSPYIYFITWHIMFRVFDQCGDEKVITLSIVEEDVRHSKYVYCDHCRVVGWSGHPVCAKRYHFIIRLDGESSGAYQKACTSCGSLVPSLELRKVSVLDVSKKYGLEYRLLHAMAIGRPWYGNWGYEFGSGSFALTEASYQEAIDLLSSRSLTPQIQALVVYYRLITGLEISTVHDLIRCLMQLLHRASGPGEIKGLERGEKLGLTGCADEEVGRVVEDFFRVLAVVGKERWISWKSLKGAVAGQGRDVRMVEFAMRRMLLEGVGRFAVRCEADAPMPEFRLEVDPSSRASTLPLPKDQLLNDLCLIYRSFHPETMPSTEPYKSAAIKILDCKHFIKDYQAQVPKLAPLLAPSKNQVTLWVRCQINDTKTYPLPPPELVSLPPTGTVADLKLEAAKIFQEVYIFFKRFQPEDILDLWGVKDDTQVNLLVGPNASVTVIGRVLGGVSGISRFRLEKGIDTWVVECSCGARDDDGERMLACDGCGVWQHTRCVGLEDSQPEPDWFLCKRCDNGDKWQKAKKPMQSEKGPRRRKPGRCRGAGGMRVRFESLPTPSVK